MKFRSGFTLGEWTVYPLEGRLVSETTEARAQPKSMDVLLCLAERPGEVVERDTILQRVWGERAQSDEPLTRCIGELRRVLGDTSAEPAYILTIPKRGYRLLQPAVGLGEVEDDGVQDTDPTRLTEAQRELRFDTLKKVGVGALVIIVAVFAEILFERFLDNTEIGSNPAAVPPEKSIGVLPFANFSSDREQEWFADGLTEEILNTLTRMPDLMVSSRTSSFAFKNTDEEVTAIAKQLGVAHILEGSVRRGADTVRVTAQLIRAADGFHLWSDTFDKKPDDVIVIQEELAFAIGNALETAMDPEALSAMVSAGTASVSAYEQYLEAIALINRFSSTGNLADIRTAMSALEQAVEADSGFASAHYRLSELWRGQMALTSFNLTLPDLGPAQQMAKFESSIGAAINSAASTPARNLYEAKRAQVKLRYRDAARFYRAYLNTRPNDYEAWFWLAQVYQQVGEFDNAYAAVEQAASHPGLDATLDSQLLWGYYRSGRAEEGAKAARELLSILPTHATALYQGHRALLWAGYTEEAAELLPRLEASDLGNNQRAIARGRQACAEGRIADANSAFATTDMAELSWVFLKILGRGDEATAAIRHLDTPERHYQLSSFMAYPHFDVTSFPNLQLVLARENVQRPPPVEIPYACSPL